MTTNVKIDSGKNKNWMQQIPGEKRLWRKRTNQWPLSITTDFLLITQETPLLKLESGGAYSALRQALDPAPPTPDQSGEHPLQCRDGRGTLPSCPNPPPCMQPWGMSQANPPAGHPYKTTGLDSSKCQ